MPTIGKKFPKSEFNRRLKRVREAMSGRELDAVLISCPENIYYLTGLDHMGYFAYQMLVVPIEGTPILITRAMERATVESQVPDLIHVGYSDASLPEIEPAAQDAAANESFGEADPWMEPQGMPTLFRIVRFFSSLLILRSIRVGAFPCQSQTLEYLQFFPQNGQPMVGSPRLPTYSNR